MSGATQNHGTTCPFHSGSAQFPLGDHSRSFKLSSIGERLRAGPKKPVQPSSISGLQRLQGPAHSWLSNQAKHSKTGDYYMPITECKDPTNTAGGNNLEARGSFISSSFAQEAVGSDPHTSRCEQNPLQALHCIALVAAAILTS